LIEDAGMRGRVELKQELTHVASVGRVFEDPAPRSGKQNYFGDSGRITSGPRRTDASPS
jgi:hypothetical protein